MLLLLLRCPRRCLYGAGVAISDSGARDASGVPSTGSAHSGDSIIVSASGDVAPARHVNPHDLPAAVVGTQAGSAM